MCSVIQRWSELWRSNFPVLLGRSQWLEQDRRKWTQKDKLMCVFFRHLTMQRAVGSSFVEENKIRASSLWYKGHYFVAYSNAILFVVFWDRISVCVALAVLELLGRPWLQRRERIGALRRTLRVLSGPGDIISVACMVPRGGRGNPGMVVHGCILPSTWVVESGGSEVQDHPFDSETSLV